MISGNLSSSMPTKFETDVRACSFLISCYMPKLGECVSSFTIPEVQILLLMYLHGFWTLGIITCKWATLLNFAPYRWQRGNVEPGLSLSSMCTNSTLFKPMSSAQLTPLLISIRWRVRWVQVPLGAFVTYQ